MIYLEKAIFSTGHRGRCGLSGSRYVTSSGDGCTILVILCSVGKAALTDVEGTVSFPMAVKDL
jgi:hypothetical protein